MVLHDLWSASLLPFLPNIGTDFLVLVADDGGNDIGSNGNHGNDSAGNGDDGDNDNDGNDYDNDNDHDRSMNMFYEQSENPDVFSGISTQATIITSV